MDVGPGNKWQAVYETVERQGLVVLGGRDGDIGVGGLTTGGGREKLSRPAQDLAMAYFLEGQPLCDAES